MPQSPFDNDAAKEALQACVVHARDLLESARMIGSAGKPNIAYHLATLALEEIGRRELLVMQIASASRPIPPAWPAKHMTNHIQKIFWAFFGAGFLASTPTADQMNEMRDLAKQIHETRLAGLYVDTANDALGIPSQAIAADELDTLVRLVDARIELAGTQTYKAEATDEDLELTEWFLDIVDDPVWRKFIFSSASMKKMEETRDVRAWIKWIKKQYDASVAKAMTAAQGELSRTVPRGRMRDKWDMKLRIESASHMIPPKVLTLWNQHVGYIKLSVPDAKKKRSMLVELMLGDDVPLQGVFWWGDVNARQFVVALNLGTRGFWWWRLPEHPGRYFETVTDLDSKSEVKLDVNERLLPWPSDVTLREGDLQYVSMSLSVLAQLTQNKANLTAFDHYLNGLKWLALNDVTLRFDADAFYAFCESLREMMALANDQRPFADALPELLAQAFPKSSKEDRAAFVALALLPENQRGIGDRIKTIDIACAKGLCDLYFLGVIGPMFAQAWGSGDPVAKSDTTS